MTPVKQKPRASSKRQQKSQRSNANIPMAYVRRPRRRQPRVSTDLNRIVVSGRDLVVPTPRSLPTGASETSVFQCIPANPIFWSGTRVSRQASMYQVYRPRKFLVHYKPQVAVTNPGLVVYGTLFQDATVTAGELQQVLNTSNGGGISPCYLSFSSKVDLRALQLRQFNTIGNPSSTDNIPFLWVATYSGYSPSAISTSSAPGWVEVEWEFEFMSGNPGTGNTGRGIFTPDETTMSAMFRARQSRGLRVFDWNMPFGVPLGIIKEVARPILRHVGAVLLDGAESTTWRYGIGKILTWVATSLRNSRSTGTTTLRDDDGSLVELPDDTPVILLMCGLPQPEEAIPQPPTRIPVSTLRVTCVWTNATPVRDAEWNVTSFGVSTTTTTAGTEEMYVSGMDDGSIEFAPVNTGADFISVSAVTPDGNVLLARYDDSDKAYWYPASSLYDWSGDEPPEPIEAIETRSELHVPQPTVQDDEIEEPEHGGTISLTDTQRQALQALLA